MKEQRNLRQENNREKRIKCLLKYGKEENGKVGENGKKKKERKWKNEKIKEWGENSG